MVPLFQDMPEQVRQSVFESPDSAVFTISKGEVIITQGTPCKHLYVLLDGLLNVEIIDGLGNCVQIEHIEAPRSFATPHLFSKDNRLPATFTTLEDSVLFTVTKEYAFQLISENPGLLKSFLCIVGNCSHCTVSRLNALSRRTVRERLVIHLLEHRDRRTNTVRLIHSQTNLATYLNVSRPALSSEINKMEREGLIRIEDAKTIHLVKPVELERMA
jgi:CRP-like cAMP-binding protein